MQQQLQTQQKQQPQNKFSSQPTGFSSPSPPPTLNNNKKATQLVLHIRELLDDTSSSSSKPNSKIGTIQPQLQNNKSSSSSLSSPHPTSQKTIRKIQNEIDGKENEIRQLFHHNIETVTEHYIRYYEICHHQKKIDIMCEQFERKIEKNKKLSEYDETMIERSQLCLEKLATVKSKLIKYRDHIRLLKKITMNVNEEKYNNAIKLYHKAKKNQEIVVKELFSKQNQSESLTMAVSKDRKVNSRPPNGTNNSSGNVNCKLLPHNLHQLIQLPKTPLIRCLPIIKQKITEHLQRLMDIFWQQNSQKQTQVGEGCFNRILSNNKEKVNIYQSFFGNSGNASSQIANPNNNRISISSAIGRSSMLNRNSFIRASIIDGSMGRNSIMMDSTTTMSMSFLKSLNEDTDILQKFIIRANVELASLKQVRFLCLSLLDSYQNKNQTSSHNINFHTLIKENIFKNLKILHENHPCQTEQNYKEILSHLIGFLLVCRQVVSSFGIKFNQNLFVDEIYLILRKQIKNIININMNSLIGNGKDGNSSKTYQIRTKKKIEADTQKKIENDTEYEKKLIIGLKEYTDIFYKVLQILKIQQNTEGYTLLLEELLKIYSGIALQRYQVLINYQIANDNLVTYQPQSSEQEMHIAIILGFQLKHLNPNNTQQTEQQQPPLKKQNPHQSSPSQLHTTPSFNFTNFIPFIITLYNEFHQHMLLIVKQSNCNKSHLHQSLATLLERIISLYGSQLIIKQHPLHIVQGQINLRYCEVVYKFYSNLLETQYGYSRTIEPGYEEKLQQLIIELRRRVRELIEHKIEIMMGSYWAENMQIYREGHADFVEWMMEYVKETVGYLKGLCGNSQRKGNVESKGDNINSVTIKTDGLVDEILYHAIGYIAYFYWQFLKDKGLKQFSLITIHNLDVDLMFIYKFLSRYMGSHLTSSNSSSSTTTISQPLKSLQQFYSLMLTNNIYDILDPSKKNMSYNAIDIRSLLEILPKYNRVSCGQLRDLKKRDIEALVKKLEKQIE